MGEVQMNGKLYENSDRASLEAMAAMGYHVFRYFPEDKIIINADSTVEAYQCKQIYTDMPYSFIDEFVDEEYRKQYIKMYQEIDAGAERSSVLFRMKKKGNMCKVTLAPAAYDEDGTLIRVLGVVEDVTDVVETQREHTSIIRGLSSIYFAIYQLDFVEGTFQELFTKDNIRATLGENGRVGDALTGMVEKLVLPESQDAMRVFNEVTTMPGRIGDKKIISQEYLGMTTGWSRASIIPNEWSRDGKPTKALYCTRTICHEREKMSLQKNLINALAGGYQDVYILNMDTGISTAYRMSSEMAMRYSRIFAAGDYEKNIKLYIEEAVLEADRKMFQRVSTLEEIDKLMEERERFSFTYREHHDGDTVYSQLQMIKPAKNRHEVIIALKNVDDDVREEIKYAKKINEQMGVIQALSNKFESVFLLNPANGVAVPYHLSDENQSHYREQIRKGIAWNDLAEGYARNGVHPDYAEEFVSEVSTDNILWELRDKKSFVYEYKNNNEQGNHFYQLKAVPVKQGGSERVIIGISDVNEERERQITVQKALQDAYSAARSANQAKTNFLANMSHDIRTPMNAIIGMTAIAATHIEDKERVQDCLKKITGASKHLLSLVNEVLDMSKIESGKIDLVDEEFNLSELIDNLLIMVRPQIEERGHELIVNINNVEHEQVMGDSLRIQQVFVNLMSNAIKYTPEGGKIHLSITEKPTNQKRVGFYEIVFEDNGIGMSEEFMKKIFEPFARAEDERIRNVQGTGLGMVISKNIVNMMGGNIEVESELDKGTKFTVTFFLELQSTEEVRYEDFVNLPVLVVDDDKTSVDSTCCMLDDLGMDTEGVLSAKEAVNKVIRRHEEQNDYFAVILDWKMPEMGGVDATRAIRKAIGNDVLIIIISAYDWSDIEQEARLAGANAFISKPLFKSRLTHLFNSLVGNEEGESESMPLQNFEEMDLSGRRVLLAEDNDLNAEIATEILKTTGVTVDVACDGAVAVDMIRERGDIRYDMIFMDIQMPKMNGYDATRAIRNLGCDYCKSVPIIAMTANAFAEDVQAALSAGMNGHIAKPLDLKALTIVLNKWIVAK